ncbi:hypothetical protein [Erythrobacter sp. JK5]|uniref:hypothetical protein n=1 Tax=Erythrobacter sp. JK5 TaxID=2829500 RepID=UPI002011E636|nr:hypothetical protein [Erythrobacter sp. JK5]
MKKLVLLTLPLTVLAACGEEPAAEPAATAVAAPESAAPSLPPPDAAVFASTFAKTCPEAKTVNDSVCRRAAMGSPEVICEYGLGDDEYLRNKTTLVQGETAWEIADPETTCAQGA